MPAPPRRTHVARRPAVVLLIVLAVLAMASLVLGSWARQHVRQARSQRLAYQRQQAAWLADSAVRRAAARLAADPRYRGEAWRVSAAELLGQDAAEVAIRVSVPGVAGVPAGASTAAQIIATADLPPGDRRRVRVTKRVAYPWPASAGKPSPADPTDNDTEPIHGP